MVATHPHIHSHQDYLICTGSHRPLRATPIQHSSNGPLGLYPYMTALMHTFDDSIHGFLNFTKRFLSRSVFSTVHGSIKASGQQHAKPGWTSFAHGVDGLIYFLWSRAGSDPHADANGDGSFAAASCLYLARRIRFGRTISTISVCNPSPGRTG